MLKIKEDEEGISEWRYMEGNTKIKEMERVGAHGLISGGIASGFNGGKGKSARTVYTSYGRPGSEKSSKTDRMSYGCNVWGNGATGILRARRPMEE